MSLHVIPYNWPGYRNYAYFLQTECHNILIDAGNFRDIQQYLLQYDLRPDVIVLTHEHHDHIRDMAKLKEYYNIPVCAPSAVNLAEIDMREDQTKKDYALRFTSLPGHSPASGIWHYEGIEGRYAFTGDVLFSCGCGRQFQGTDERLYQAMSHIATLPEDTWLCCGHEYTSGNLKFALQHFPHDQALKDYYQQVRQKVVQKQSTLPVLLKMEKQVNPFLRYNDSKLWSVLGVDNALDYLLKLRYLKDL